MTNPVAGTFIKASIKNTFKAFLLIYLSITLVFFALAFLKGNPVSMYVDPRLSQDLRQNLEQQYGYHLSVPAQYGRYLASICTGSFGVSFVYKKPVIDLLPSHLLQSFWLGGCGLAIGMLLSLIFLWGQNLPESKLVKRFFHSVTSLFLGVPAFLSGLFLLFIFGFKLQILPTFGSERLFSEGIGGWSLFLDKLMHAILPGLSIGLALAARFTTFLNQELQHMDEQPFIRSARGRGVSERRIFWKHKMLGLLPSALQLFGLYLPLLVSGALVLEHLFGWAGMGTLMFDAVAARDFPVLLGGTIVTTGSVIVGYQLADIARAYLINVKYNLNKPSGEIR